MDQSIINYAQSQRQELRRQSKIFSQLKVQHYPRLKLFPQLRETVAQWLINLGTRLKAKGPASSRADQFSTTFLAESINASPTK